MKENLPLSGDIALHNLNASYINKILINGSFYAQRLISVVYTNRPIALGSLRSSLPAFTLAELLIALAILGVIATFTIPKVLNSGQNGKNTAIAKEAASMISGAFSSYQLNNSIASGTGPANLTQYMNYVSVDTATNYAAASGQQGTALTACTATLQCLKLHNGGVLQYATNNSFGGTATTNAIYFSVDPDGTGTQGSINFIQYYNGRLTTGGNAATGTTSTNSGVTAVGTDPGYLLNWQ